MRSALSDRYSAVRLLGLGATMAGLAVGVVFMASAQVTVPPSTYSITVTKTDGNGTVSVVRVVGAGAVKTGLCPATSGASNFVCSITNIPIKAYIVLKANPAPGSLFGGWSA